MAVVTEEHAERLIELFEQSYPDFEGFDKDERFKQDELDSKKEATETAQKKIGAKNFAFLESTSPIWMSEQESFFNSLREVAQATNLLFLRNSAKGDLAPIYHSSFEPVELSEAIASLLHGTGSSRERIETFSQALKERENKLSDVRPGSLRKWTFPTYYLFLLNPQIDLLIKPEVIKWFLRLISKEGVYEPILSGEIYQSILGFADELTERLAELDPRYGARDQIDLQSFLWVSHRAAQRARTAERNKAKQKVRLQTPDLGQYAEDEISLQTDADPDFVPGVGTKETAPSAATAPSPTTRQPTFKLTDLTRETHYPATDLQDWLRALRSKRQLVLYGPPGTGKTYVAKRLARTLVSETTGLVEMVQFHPSYSYEDFIQGLRPRQGKDGGLEYHIEPGRFVAFCNEARNREGPSVMILDEINRARLAQVFGELMYLLEYREETVRLARSGELFSIPKNVYLIGTMNTADRSIALVDHALRRRFRFVRLDPSMDLLRAFQAQGENSPPAEWVERLVGKLEQVNEAIGNRDFSIGVSYFLQSNLAVQLEDIWRMEIIPYLEEQLFDQPEVVDLFRWEAVQEELES